MIDPVPAIGKMLDGGADMSTIIFIISHLECDGPDNGGAVRVGRP